MLQRPILANWDPLSSFEAGSDDSSLHGSHQDHEMFHHAQALFNIPSCTPAVLHVDLREGHVFRVDGDRDVLTQEDLAKHWHDFEISDAAQVKKFVDEKAFTKLHVTKVTDSMTVVDCTWLRKYKRMPDGTRKQNPGCVLEVFLILNVMTCLQDRPQLHSCPNE